MQDGRDGRTCRDRCTLPGGPDDCRDRLFRASSAAGLGIAAVTAYRKRFLAAARIAAYSLVPVGLVMTGVVEWLADTAFSPTAWAGFGVLGVAWLLFMTTRAVERRSGGTRKERKAAARRRSASAVAPAASAPSLGPGTGGRPAGQAATKPAAGARGRGLQRHRGDPQEARHLTSRNRPETSLGSPGAPGNDHKPAVDHGFRELACFP